MAFALSGCPQAGPPLTITPSSLPNGVVGVAYSQTLSSDGRTPVTWEVAGGSLPPGLTLDERSGVISGTPTAAGTYTASVAVSDASLPHATGELDITITIIGQLTLDPALEPARVGVAYSDTFAVSGGVAPYTFSIIGLPAGLTYDPATGTITGTPLNSYSGLSLQVTVTDSGDPAQSLTKGAIFVVKPPPVTITTSSLADGKVNQFPPYSQQLATANGTPPYSWAVVSGVLPHGLDLNLTTGVIRGTPDTAGSSTFTIQVSDNDTPKTTAVKQFTITIAP
jgi:hypothetical protein